ncbi:MAG: TylF/MycF/NovP-related O-methyltransferase [Candidatus Binataceae bacterium]
MRDHVLISPMVRTGWRPATSIPLSPVYFNGSYGYEDEENIKSDVAIVHKHSMASFERLATLWQQVRYLDGFRIPGVLVECGVWKGGAAGLMALAHMRSNAAPFRDLHLFDSFEGLPAPRMEVDGAIAHEVAEAGDGMLQAIGQLAASPDNCEELLLGIIGYPADLVHFHVGWFQDTVPRDADSIGEIALLRLAGDWYESTRIPLQYLYQKVVSRGVIAIADYGAFEGSRRAVDEFLTSQSVPIMLHHVDSAGRYWIKP